MGEFDFIARHFRPLAGKGAYDLRNDGAVIAPAPGCELALSSDTMVENLHFLPDDPPETIGKKLMRCNLSDLAAMGARPKAYMLNVTVPPGGAYDEAWFAGFTRGLAQDQQTYGLSLLGGDTTGTTGPLVLTMTIFGDVQVGQALRRDKARPGDDVWVTGSLGKAALGLQARKGKIADPTGELVAAYRVPTPRVGLPLAGIVTTAMDVSDGLLQDAGHIAEESGVKVTLEEAALPFSPSVEAAKNGAWRETCLLGGDDYELLMTAPPEKSEALQSVCAAAGVPLTRIGKVTAGEGVQMLGKSGEPLRFSRTGWQHF